MSPHSPKQSVSPGHESNLASENPILHWASGLLCGAAVIYALLAGLHTLQDFDLGWQLATGRWVLHHHQIFSTDVFSYTAHGAPWIYPALSGIVFYLTYLIGGYTLLCWLGALTCAGTVALLLRRNNLANVALALIAVPLIANRTQPRAEMFTTILFAAFLSLLWRHYRRRDQNHSASSLWLLPLLMVLWVNLHLGFVSGLALCGVYILLELLDFFSNEGRSAASARLRRAGPWLLLTLAATFINPWGPSIYAALIRQQRAQTLHSTWIVEWESISLSWSSLQQALHLRDPQSSFWWLLALSLIACAIALWRRRWGAVALLLCSGYFTIQHLRLEALFACVTVVIGGSIFQEALTAGRMTSRANSKISKNRSKTERSAHKRFFFPSWASAFLIVLTVSLIALTGIRSYDLVSNRYLLKSSQLSQFGTGISWWFPERAVDFIQREKIPANIFNPYSLGGYLTWRLFPEYSDYIDSRAIPFGSQVFFRAYELSVASPDSKMWQQEADARGINTIIVPLGRYQGITLFPQLPAFCSSQTWRPVYLDEVSAVFVRRTAETTALIDRLQIDCDKTLFVPLNAAATSSRSKADQFNFYANAAGVLYALGRFPETLVDLDRAQAIFSDNANLHLTRALVLEHTGHAAQAEAEFHTSISLEPTDESFVDLGLFYMTQKRYAEAAERFRRSAETSARPHDMWMLLGQAELQMNQPQPALEAFDKAEASSPFRGGGESLGAGFNSLIATGRAKAWYQLGDVAKAVSFQEEAVSLAPNDSKLWLGLADLYDAEGNTAKAEQARRHVTAK